MNRKYLMGFILVCIFVLILPSGCKKSASTSRIGNGSGSEQQIDSAQFSGDSSQEPETKVKKKLENMAHREEINGKQIDFKYARSQNPIGGEVHGTDIYISSDGSEAHYDEVTGQFMFFTIGEFPEEIGTISEAEAAQIAKEFIGRYCDISQYQFIEIKFNESIQKYYITYSKMVAGYKTSEIIYVSLTSDGTLTSFVYNPYVFDNVAVKPINEEVFLAKLDKEIKDKYKALDNYEIKDKRLSVDQNGKVNIDFFVAIHFLKGSATTSTGMVFSYLVS